MDPRVFVELYILMKVEKNRVVTEFKARSHPFAVTKLKHHPSMD